MNEKLNRKEETMETNNVTALVPLQQQHAMALEPMNHDDAWRFCEIAIESNLLPRAVQKPEQAYLILMRGREMGLTAMQSLSSINVIEGKTSLSAELIVARVKQAKGVCKYFRFVSGDETQATFETWRIDEPEATRFTFTFEDAIKLRLADKDNYKKQPKTMLRWRCATTLARLVYPELTLGLYSPDEAEDIALGNEAALGLPSTPPKPVLDAELVTPSGAVKVEPAVAPAKETESALAQRLIKACADATTKEQLKPVFKEGGAMAKGPHRDAVLSAYTAALERIKKPAPAPAAPSDAEDTGPCGWIDGEGVECQKESRLQRGVGYRCDDHRLDREPGAEG